LSISTRARSGIGLTDEGIVQTCSCTGRKIDRYNQHGLDGLYDAWGMAARPGFL